MKSGARTRLMAGLFGLVIVVVMTGWRLWWAPASVDSRQPALADGTAAVTRLGGESAPQAGEGAYPRDTPETGGSVAARPIADPAVAPRQLQPEPDYEAQIRGVDLPPALLDLIQSAYIEFARGNLEYAAMLAQEAVALSDGHPVVKPILYGMIGYAYERLGYIDMAVEHYRLALAIHPLQRNSYNGMRRLDPQFAATRPELHPAPSTQKEQKTETVQ